MIDLSYLTEEEQEMILTVLQRDAELKKAEEDRVRQLQKLPTDRGKMKYMTGEWFYETKSQRHMDRIHGSDIIRASMKPQNPMTLFNLTQSWKARTRAGSNGKEDILPPPKPLRQNLGPPQRPEEERETGSASPDTRLDGLRPAVRTPSKRHNPFNRASLVLESLGETDSQLTGGAKEPLEAPAGESLSPLKSDIAGLTDDLSSEGPGALRAIDMKLEPTPKKRTILFRPLDTLNDNDSPLPRWGDRRASRSKLPIPRGVLKPSTSWSSNDSGLPYEGAGRRLELCGDPLSWSSATAPEGECTEEGGEDKSLSSLYSKQEKFRLKQTARGTELSEGREFGDEDLLDLDHPTPSDEGRGKVEPATGCERDDGSNGLSLVQCMTVCVQPQEEKGCSSDVSGTLKDSARPLLLSRESKFGWMAHTKFPPYLRMPPPVSEPQRHRWTGGRAEAGTEEAMAEREVVAMRWDDVCPPRNPVGQYETQADSNPPQVPYLPSPMNEKGKPVYVGMGNIKTPPVLDVQSPEFIEGDSIAKVLEWFHRRSNSGDHQDEHLCQQEVDVETRNQPGAPEADITKHSGGSPTAEMRRRAQLEISTRLEEKDISFVEGATKTQSPIEQEGTYPKSAGGDLVILQHLAHSSLHTDSAYHSNLQVSAVDTKPQTHKKENAIDIKEEHDRETQAILVSPVTKATQKDVKQSVARNDWLSQIVGDMKSFWEKGNSGPEILINTSGTISKHNGMEPASQTDRKKMESKADFCKVGQEVQLRPEETCLNIKDEVYGTCVSHSRSHNLVQDIDNNIKPVDMEVVSDQCASSVLPLAQEDSLERAGNHHRELDLALAPVCTDKPLPLERSHLIESLDEEEKYIAKCIVIDEDMEIPVSSVEGKTDLNKFPLKEEVTYRMAPMSRQVAPLGEQSSSAPDVKQRPNELDDSADKIRHLKDFWESEKHDPKIITSQPKEEIADNKESQFPDAASSSNQNSTKSEFEIRMIATDNDCSASPLKEGPNFTVISMKQRMEKASMGQSPSNLQFKNLRDFWDGTPSDGQNSWLPSTERLSLSPKSSQLKGQESGVKALEKSLSPTGDKRPYLNPNYYPKLPSKDLGISNLRAQRTEEYNLKTYALNISPPKSKPKTKKPLHPTPLPRQASRSSDEMNVTRSSKIGPSTETERKQSRRRAGAEQEQQNSLSHRCSGRRSDPAPPIKERTCLAQRDPQQPRRPSLGKVTGRVNLSKEQQDVSSEHLRKTQKELPGGRQPSHRKATERQPSGTSNSGERPQPLARSIIPYDYNHYLGIPEGAAFQSMPATKKEEATSSCIQPEQELCVGSGPVRSSTPVVPEEPQARSEGQIPWHSPGTDEVDLDSYRSSTGETGSYSRTSSASGDEDIISVRKALERSKLRPGAISKSAEDISSLPTREEEETSEHSSRGELRLSMDDASVIPLYPPLFISDPVQMKSMSKSVPSFLQKESSRRDSDSTSGSSVHTSRLTTMGSSLTNLSSSSGMSSISSSVMSVYSGDFGNVEVRGTIQFTLNYVQKLKEFHIFVVQCRDLAAVDPEKNRSNPYVKSYLIPDQAKLGKRKTSVKKKTLHPNFNEILRYRVRFETIKTQMLNLSVWHNDTFGRNIFLGEVEVDLSKWDFGNTQMSNLTLKPRIHSGFQASGYRGEIRLSLRFLPETSNSKNPSDTGEVHIWVKDCKDLPIIRGTSINPFVRCFVLPDTSRKSRQKTRILKRTHNPAFNHTMVYDGFRAEDLPEACVELTVWDYDHIASHLVGGLRLGLGTGKSYGEAVGWMDSSTDEANLWERMMDSPKEWVDDVLPLRMLTIAKNMWK